MAEIGAGEGGIGAAVFLRAAGGNPLGLPFRRVEKPHRPRRGRAPVGSFAGRIPRADFPKNLLRGFQTGSAIENLNGIIGIDLATVPQIAGIRFQRVFA